jgi:hypothetical protein
MAATSPGMALPVMPRALQSCQGHSRVSRIDNLPACQSASHNIHLLTWQSYHSGAMHHAATGSQLYVQADRYAAVLVHCLLCM